MQQAIKQLHQGYVTIGHIGPLRNLLMGAGFAYAVEKDSAWWHYPLIFVVPTPYVGYHTFKKREAIRTSFQDLLRAGYTSSTTISSEGVLSAAAGAPVTKELK